MIIDRPDGMSRRTFVLATAVLAAGGCMGGGPRGSLRLAAGERGGLYLAFAELLAERIRARYPTRVEVIPTEGSVDNLARLRAGDVDMGLALADVAEQDRATAADTAPHAVARVYENYLQVIIRDSAGIRQLSDLQGRPVSIGAAGSGAAATSRVLFDTAGLAGRIQALTFRLRDALSGLADGTVDALVWSGGVPTPAIAELDTTLPLRMLDLSRQVVPMAEGSGYPYLVRPVPTVSYVPPGLRSIGVPNLLLCHPTMPRTWSPPSSTSSQPRRRGWSPLTSAACSTSTHPR